MICIQIQLGQNLSEYQWQ